jgi:hypothetical protein
MSREVKKKISIISPILLKKRKKRTPHKNSVNGNNMGFEIIQGT